MPTDAGTVPEKKKDDQPAPPPMPEPVQETEPPVMTAHNEEPPPENEPVQQEKPSEKKVVRVESILDKFRQYKGEKSPKALKALFTSPEGLVQDPLVALSDGSTKIKVSMERTGTDKQTPNFSLKGAKLINLGLDKDAVCVLELLPDKGAYEATITLLQDGLIKELPLTVAPPFPADIKIGVKGRLSEADFALFLKERGTEKAPRFDLNGDGKRDYIDDYIFTANYIVGNAQKKTEPAKAK